MKFLLKWIVGAGALYLTVLAGKALGIRGLSLDGAVGALFSIAALTLVNTFLRPLINLLALPINCLTMGLFRFVVNALLFWWVGTLGLGLSVRGFLPALFGSVVLSVVSGILDTLVVERAESRS